MSVIVPIYNAERYLPECLESIANQVYENFEVILVDDGSTDGSGKICEEYAAGDNRFYVIHTENAGAMCARRAGIEYAAGEYIAFVDADDWIDKDFIGCGMSLMRAEKADLVITACILEKGNISEIQRNHLDPGVYDRSRLENEVWPVMLWAGGFYKFGLLPYMWNKFYRKELLEACCKDIDPRIYDGEDVAVVFPYLLKSQKVIITEDTKYHYRIHSESVSAKKRDDFYENCARLYLHLASVFGTGEYRQCMMPQLDQYMQMMIWLKNPGGFTEAIKNIFPFKKVPKGASIILYGAGYVGQVFYHQLMLSDYCKIVAWVDQAYQRKELREKGVVGQQALSTMDYEYVVLAVADGHVSAEIANQLVHIGVERRKIIFGISE